MEEFYPSEIARLILGYLKEVKCTASWQTFLNESADLQEHNRLFKEGKIYPTNVNGKSLLDILSEYCDLKREAINNENQNKSKNISQSSDSEAFKTPNKAVHDAFTKFTLNQKIQTQSVSMSYGQGRLQSPSVRNDILYHRSPTSRPISRTPRRLYGCQATPLNFGQDAESTVNIESTNQSYRDASSTKSRSSFFRTPSKRDDTTNENVCLSDPVVSSRPRIQDGVEQADLVLSEGRTNAGHCSIQNEQLNLPSSSCFSPSSSGAGPHCINAFQPEDNCDKNCFSSYSKPNVGPQDPTASDSVEISPAVVNKSLVYRSSEITASDGNIIMTTMESSVTPQYVTDPPPYNRAPNTNSPRIILSLDRSQISSLTTPMKEKKCWIEELCSPRRKGFIPRRRLLSESPAPKQLQCPETIPPFSTIHDDLAALDELFSYQPLAEKIAENINKAKCGDELKETDGSNSYSTLQDISGSEEIIKNVLARTTADPVFDEYFSMLYSARDCTEANFPKAAPVPSHHECKSSGTDNNVEKHNQENTNSSDISRVGNFESTDVSEIEQTKNIESSNRGCIMTEGESNSNPPFTDSVNCEISSSEQKSSEITNNICTEKFAVDLSDKNNIDVHDGVDSSFSKNSSEIISCSVGNENINLNSTECNISATENASELSSGVKISTAINTMEVDIEGEKDSVKKETSTNNTETVKTTICGDTLSKVVQIANIADSCSNQAPTAQIQNGTPIFELPCPSVPTLLVPSFSQNVFPVQNNVQYRIILPAGFGSTSVCETYLPLPTFQVADNVITNPGIVISPSKASVNDGNVQIQPESIGNYISFPSKINNSKAPFTCSPEKSPSKVKTPKSHTRSYKRKKKNENEDSSKRKKDTDPKSPTTQKRKARAIRFKKKKLRPLFGDTKDVNKQVITERVEDNFPVLSIPEPSPSNSDQQTAFEIFSKITNKLEVQSPVLKSLITSATVLSEKGGRLNSTHVRCLDFDSTSSKQVKENESEKKDVQNRRSERIKGKKNIQIPEVKSFCNDIKKRLKVNKHDTSPHKNKRKMGSPRKVIQVSQPNSSTNNMINAILSCMDEAINGDKGTSEWTDCAEVGEKSVLENASDQNNSSNTALDMLPDPDDVNHCIDNSTAYVMSRDEYFPEISNSPCVLDTNQDTRIKDLPNSLKDTIHSKINKHKGADSIANAFSAKKQDVKNKSISTSNETIFGSNSEHPKDTSKKNIQDVGKNIPHSKKKKKSNSSKKHSIVKHSEISTSLETKINSLTGVRKGSTDHGNDIENVCNKFSFPEETDSLKVICSKKQLLVSIVPVDANLHHAAAIGNVNTLEKLEGSKITMCQKQNDSFVESKNFIQNLEENDLNEVKFASEAEDIVEFASNNSISMSPNKSPMKEPILHKILSLDAEKLTGNKSSPISKQSHIPVDVSSDISASAGTENANDKNILVENVLVHKKLSSDDSDSHNSVNLPVQEAYRNESAHIPGKKKYVDCTKDSNNIINPDLLDNMSTSTPQVNVSSHCKKRDIGAISKKYVHHINDGETDLFGNCTPTLENISKKRTEKNLSACNAESKCTGKSGLNEKSSSSSDLFEMPKDVVHSEPEKVKGFVHEHESTHVSISQKSPRSNFITSYFYPSSSKRAGSNDKASNLVENNQTVDKLENASNSFKNKPSEIHETPDLIKTVDTELDSIPKHSDISPLKVINNNNGQITKCSSVESKLNAIVIVSESSDKGYKIDNKLSSKSISFEKTFGQETPLFLEASICEMEKSNNSEKLLSDLPSPTITDGTVKSKCAQIIKDVSHNSDSVESRKTATEIKSLIGLALNMFPKEKKNITSFKCNPKVPSPQKIPPLESKIKSNSLTGQKNISPAFSSSYEADEERTLKKADLPSSGAKSNKNKQTISPVDSSIKNINSLSDHVIETIEFAKAKKVRAKMACEVTSPASEVQLSRDVQSVSIPKKSFQNSFIDRRKTSSNNITSKFDSVKKIMSPVKILNKETTINKTLNSRSKVIESSLPATHNSNINKIPKKLNSNDEFEDNKLADFPKSISFNPISKSVDIHNSSSCMSDISGSKYKNSSELPPRPSQSLDSFLSNRSPIDHGETKCEEEAFNELQSCRDLNVGKSSVMASEVLSSYSPSVISKIAVGNRTLRGSPSYNCDTNRKEKSGDELLFPKVHPPSVKHLNSDDLTDTGSFVSGTLEIDEKWSESDKLSENDKNNSSDELIDNFEVNVESENQMPAVVEQENAFADKCDTLKNTNLNKSPNKASLHKSSFTKENSKNACLPSENVSPVSNITDGESPRTILYSPDREKIIAQEKSNPTSSTLHYSGEMKHALLPHSQSKITKQQSHNSNLLSKERYKNPETALQSTCKDKRLRDVSENNSNLAADESNSFTCKVLPPPKKRIRPVSISSPSSQAFITYTPFMCNNAMSDVQTISNLGNASKKQSPVKVRAETVAVGSSIKSKEKLNKPKKSVFLNSETHSNCVLKPSNLNDQSRSSPFKSISLFSESYSPIKQPVFKIPTFKSPSPKRGDFKQFSQSPVLPSGKPKAMSEIYRNAFPNKDLPISPISFSNSSCTGDAFSARRQLIDNESCSISPSKASESCPENAESVHNTAGKHVPENKETGINVKNPAIVNDKKIVENPNNDSSEASVENPNSDSSKAHCSKDFESEEHIDSTSGRIRKISDSILSDTCSTLVDCSDLEIVTPEKCNDFYNDELFATTSSPIRLRKRKLSKLCSSPDCTPEKINKISISSDNINSENAKSQLVESPSHLTSNKILKSKTPAKTASQNFPHLLANLNPNSMTVVQKNIDKDFAIPFPDAKSSNKNLISPPFFQYSQNSSVKKRIAHKSHVKNIFSKTLSSSNVSNAEHKESPISNKYSTSIYPHLKKSLNLPVKNVSCISSPQSSHNYRKSLQGPLTKFSENVSFPRSRVNSKNYRYSPVRSISRPNRLINKTALSKKLEQDPCIPAGVKIPSKWNSKKIINYSDAIGQSSSFRNRSKTNSSSGKRVKRSRPTIKIAAKSPIKLLHSSKNHSMHKSYSDVSTKFVENEKKLSKETPDENKKNNFKSSSTNKPSDRNSKDDICKKSTKLAEENILTSKSIKGKNVPALKFTPEKAMKTYSRVSEKSNFITNSKQPANKFVIDFENTRDLVESDIGRSNEEGSELANAIAFLTKSVPVPETPQHAVVAGETNILEESVKRVCEPGSAMNPVTPAKEVPENVKLNLLLSKIETIGIDSILDLIKSREKD